MGLTLAQRQYVACSGWGKVYAGLSSILTAVFGVRHKELPGILKSFQWSKVPTARSGHVLSARGLLIALNLDSAKSSLAAFRRGR